MNWYNFSNLQTTYRVAKLASKFLVGGPHYIVGRSHYIALIYVMCSYHTDVFIGKGKVENTTLKILLG